MPSAAFHARHASAIRRATGYAGIALTWGAVQFEAVKNPPRPQPLEAAADRNDGDDTACELHAQAADFPAGLPRQGDILTDTAGGSYRIARVETTPGLPGVIFHIPHVTA